MTKINFPLSKGYQTYDISAQPLQDEMGKIIGVTTIAVNITEQLEAHKEHSRLLSRLKSEEERSNTILSTVPVGVSIAIDLNCTKIIHNPEASKFLRISTWQSLSHSNNPLPPVQMFCDGKLLAPEEMPIQLADWKGESRTGMEIEFVWADGIKKTGLYNCCPLFDGDGKIISGLATCQDITDIKLAEENLKKQKEILEIRVREKTDELRTRGQKPNYDSKGVSALFE